MTNVLEGIEEFVANIDHGIDKLKIKREFLTDMDHVCYRVETEERYQTLLRELSRSAHLLGQPEMVSGRPIATFQFDEPVVVGNWAPSYLELPAPKEGSAYPEGLEHAEFVVRGGDLAAFEAAHQHLRDKFSYKGMNKPLNPELGLKAAGISIKFHELALGKVVRIEQGIHRNNDPITGNHVTL